MKSTIRGVQLGNLAPGAEFETLLTNRRGYVTKQTNSLESGVTVKFRDSGTKPFRLDPQILVRPVNR